MLSKSVHCIVTSPPYWALRDYGLEPKKWPAVDYSIFGVPVHVPEMTCCLGLEPTPRAFVGHMVLIFREAYRVLRDDGTLWLNLGDSYASSAKNKTVEHQTKRTGLSGSTASQVASKTQPNKIVDYLKPKDLVGIPWMVAYALRDDGWYLRQDIIWGKPNPMPENVTDRCVKAHEYIFLLSKSKNYFFDSEAIKTDAKVSTMTRMERGRNEDNKWKEGAPGQVRHSIHQPSVNVRKSGNKQRRTGAERGCPENTGSNVCSSVPWEGVKANKRSVWEVPVKGFSGDHYATFPQELIVDCIRSGTSEHGCCAECGKPYERQVEKELVPTDKASFNSVPDERDEKADKQDAGSNRQKDGHKPGWAYASKTMGWKKSCKCATDSIVPAVVLDMFGGRNTTGIAARKNGRNFIAIEANEKDVLKARERTYQELGIFSGAG